MASLQFTDADRDERGFVKVPAPAEPRSLADLLPTPQSIQADAQRKPASNGEQAMLIVTAIGLAVVLFLWFGSGGDIPATSPQSIPAAPQEHGDRTATPSPIPAAASAMLPAYAAPNGVELGEIEDTRAITPTAHYGEDWIQADVQGSGRIWLRVSDWPRLAIVGPDLAPRPTATTRPYVPPTATPEPPRCETEADIKFISEHDVIIDGLPRGHAIGRSCFSQAEADTNADANEQAVIAKYRARPTATTVPAPTPMPLTQIRSAP